MGDGVDEVRPWRWAMAFGLTLLVLATFWPDRLPVADVAADLVLLTAGGLLARHLLDLRGTPHAAWHLLAGLLREVIVPALVVLAAVALAVPRWFAFERWEPLYADLRTAALGLANIRDLSAGSPVESFWLVALIVQSSVVVGVAVVVGRRRPVAIALVAVPTVASVVLGERFWPFGLGALIVLAGAPTSLPLRFPGAGGAFMLRAAWAAQLAAGPALVVTAVAAGHDLDRSDRIALLAAVAGFAVVVAGAVTLVAALRVPWLAVLAPTAVAALVLAPTAASAAEAQAEVDEVSDAIARVQRDLAGAYPACFGAAYAALDGRGPGCDDPALSSTITPAPDQVGQDKVPLPDCFQQAYVTDVRVCDLGSTPGAPRVLVLGDSHARVMLAGFQRLAEIGAISLTAATKASCTWNSTPLALPDAERVAACDGWRASLTAWLEQNVRQFDVVVTTGFEQRIDGSARERAAGLAAAWQPVLRAGVPVVALSDNPWPPEDPNDCLARVGAARADRCALPRSALADDSYARAVEETDGAFHADLAPFYCDATRCPVVIGGANVYRDDSHLTGTYARTLAPYLYAAMARPGLLHGMPH